MQSKLDVLFWGEQVIRLQSVFKGKYPEERVRALWDRVKYFDSFWIRKTVDHAIEAFQDIKWHEEIAKKRERDWEAKKSMDGGWPTISDLEARNNSIFSKEDVAEFFKIMKQASTKQISAKEASDYAAMLRNTIRSKTGIKCEKCTDIGLVFKYDERNYEYVFRCSCITGRNRPENYTFITDRNILRFPTTESDKHP